MSRASRATAGALRLRSLATAVVTIVAILGARPASPATDAPPAGGVLRVCGDPDNLPFSSATGGERGLYVDLAELVAAKLGVRTEYAWWYTFYGKRALRNTLLADRCDAFFGLPDDPTFMERSVARTRPFLEVGWAIIAPAQLAFAQVEDLKSKRLGVVFGSTPQLLLAVRGGFPTTTFRTDEDALDALARGELDAALVWGPTAGYRNARKLHGAYRVVAVSGEGLQWKASVAVRKDDAALRDRIDGALATLDADIRALADRYGFPRGPAIALDAKPVPPPPGASTATATLTASTGAVSAPAPAAATPDADTIAAGRSAFNQHCSHCHAPNAMSPEPSRDLRRLRLRYGAKTPDVFYATVTRGRPDKGMPSWSNLDAATLQRVWTFLDSVQTEP